MTVTIETPSTRAITTVEAYVDGSLLPLQGSGGAAVWVNANEWHAWGFQQPDNNNQMEWMAALAALKLFPSAHLRLITDSEVVATGVGGQLAIWAARGWRKTNRKRLADAQVMRSVHRLLERRNALGLVTDIRWVHGHSGNAGNCEADRHARKLAKTAAELRRRGIDHMVSAMRAGLNRPVLVRPDGTVVAPVM